MQEVLKIKHRKPQEDYLFRNWNKATALLWSEHDLAFPFLEAEFYDHYFFVSCFFFHGKKRSAPFRLRAGWTQSRGLLCIRNSKFVGMPSFLQILIKRYKYERFTKFENQSSYTPLKKNWHLCFSYFICKIDSTYLPMVFT